MRHQAIYNTHPDASCIRDDVAFDKDNNPVVLDEVKIKVEQDSLDAVFASKAYARSRKVEYDALNQLELISDDANNGTTTHKDAVNAIKAKYPKPE